MAAIVVHGGAGRDDEATRPARHAGVLRAAEVGWTVLAAGGSALDAVVDAVFLVGEPASALAARHGLRIVPPDALITDDARRRWRAQQAAPGETVGAVACDARGRVAAATSTGGVAGKRRGRVGDAAVIGAGTWADDRTAAGSATGPGELIIRLGMTRMACELIGGGATPDDAARRVLDELRARLGGTAGLIVVDATGRVGSSFTTDGMPAAWRADGMPAAALRR